MDTPDALPQFSSAFAAKRVYSEPYTVDGTTVITAAAISGGAGMRQSASSDDAAGKRAGMGGAARPVGAYVLREGRVMWKPAIDVERVLARGLLIGAVIVAGALLLRR